MRWMRFDKSAGQFVAFFTEKFDKKKYNAVKKEKIKIGYIGLGTRGKGVLRTSFSRMKDVEVVMLCDTYEPYLEDAQKASCII